MRHLLAMLGMFHVSAVGTFAAIGASAIGGLWALRSVSSAAGAATHPTDQGEPGGRGIRTPLMDGPAAGAAWRAVGPLSREVHLMTRRRTVAALAGSALAALLCCGVAGSPAQAHGAPSDPPSRAWACGPEGGKLAATPACKAAVAASGSLEDWDNIRVANVNGRDRQVIPDGKLCSAGIAGYRGLDLARTDWPATNLSPGATMTLRYRTTIPHQGTFRVYLTRSGYDASKPLSWADLDAAPFLTATDPAVTGGAYVLKGTVPGGRTGRHLIFVIWQNSSTADTYYSCSDVVFPAAASPPRPPGQQSAPPSGGGGVGVGAAPAGAAAGSPSVTASAGSPTASAQSPPGGGLRPVAATSGASRALPLAAGGALAMLAVAGGVALLVRRRRQ
jgi:chitin-binding protein